MSQWGEDAQALDPVLAHSLLGTVAAIKGAIDTVMAHKLEGASRDGLLLMATRRLDHLAEQLRHLALGLPSAEDVLFNSAFEEPSGLDRSETLRSSVPRPME